MERMRCFVRSGGSFFFKFRKLQRIVNFGNGVQGLARDIPELGAVIIVKTQQCDGEYAAGFADAGEKFLIGRKPVIEPALRIVAE